jgi:hypothetical protein
MSINCVLFLASCFAMYKLGAYNANHPGEAWLTLRGSIVQIWRWMNQ